MEEIKKYVHNNGDEVILLTDGTNYILKFNDKHVVSFLFKEAAVTFFNIHKEEKFDSLLKSVLGY